MAPARHLALCSFCLLAALRCSSDHHDQSAAAQGAVMSMSGQVKTEAGASLAGASVCVVAKNTCITTDANGMYTSPYDNSIPEPLVVNFSAAGYASRSARMFNATTSQAPIALRPVDMQVQVHLPATGEEPVTVTASHGDANSTLSIPAAALVGADGQIAAGDANVSFTFWHPLQPLVSLPANLLAQDGNGGLKGLETWGMADIVIEQQGVPLQIAQGKVVGWSVVEPMVVAQAISPNHQVVSPMPDLYALNTQTGLWQLEGTQASGALSFDSNTRTMSTMLPHLSSWNVDADAGPQWGGCVSGTLIDPCGKPNANMAYTVWYLGQEQLKDWRGGVSHADGSFCTDTYLSAFNVTGGALNINYFVSGADSYTDTAMCNPAPASCFNCQDESVVKYFTMGWCSNCVLDPSLATGAGESGASSLTYGNTCGAPSVNLIPYSSCAANNCVNIGNITLSSTTCDKKAGTSGNPNQVVDPCAAGGGGATLGAACAPGQTCCPQATLTCADHVCVPINDPTTETGG